MNNDWQKFIETCAASAKYYDGKPEHGADADTIADLYRTIAVLTGMVKDLANRTDMAGSLEQHFSKQK